MNDIHNPLIPKPIFVVRPKGPLLFKKNDDDNSNDDGLYESFMLGWILDAFGSQNLLELEKCCQWQACRCRD